MKVFPFCYLYVMSEKIKIYTLHYRCGYEEVRGTCREMACDLCNCQTPLYYEEMEVDKDELFNLLNIPSFNSGNYIHISNVKPEGWISKEDYYSFR